MRKKFHGWAMASLLLCAVGLAHAQTDSATAESLMRKSGLWQQLADTAPQVRKGVEESLGKSGTGLSPSETQRILDAADQAYAPDRLRSLTRDLIARKVSAGHVGALQRWYQSPLGTAVTRLEEVASSGLGDPERVVQEGAAMLAGLSRPRRRLIDRIVVVTRTAEAMTSRMINDAMGVQIGVASAAPSGNSPSSAELRVALEAQRGAMQQAFTQMATAMYAKVYAPLSDVDMAKYAEFLESAAGRHFTDVGMQAVDMALTDAATSLGRRIPGAKDGSNT